MFIYHQSFLFDESSPVGTFKAIKDAFSEEFVHLFESVSSDSQSASIITIGAREQIITKDDCSFYIDSNDKQRSIAKNPLLFLKDYYAKIDTEKHKQVSYELGIRFLDGFVGHIAYDMMQYFEPKLYSHMNALEDTMGIEDFYFVRPKIIITFANNNSKIILTTTDEKYKPLLNSIATFLQTTPIQHIPIQKIQGVNEINYHLSKDEFINIVKKCKQMIRQGDVFQILPSNRATLKSKIDKHSFYRTLRSINPSPYMFYLDYDSYAIIGSSPETLVSLTNSVATLSPIAGTRKRGKSLEQDKFFEQEMLNDEKEVAEHIMLVDLGRNDLGRVSEAGSVKPTELMSVERYSHVMHMVSSLTSRLDAKYDMFDLLMATFTAGTMTGTPKVRAMELIAEYEKLKRGFYSGVVGYFGFDGNMDTAIAIRTACLKDDEIILQAGAGIVADSQEELEYLEVQNKLMALIKTIESLKENA